jgi:AcrR family transcriptional regulator
MPPKDQPLSRDRILAAAEEIVRRFGPTKATVVDLARALGVSHAAVYRHVKSKAELRDLVVGRWVETIMPPLREIAGEGGRKGGSDDAPRRLRRFFDGLIAAKRKRAAGDPELFAAYLALAVEAEPVIKAHIDEMVRLTASIVKAGVADGSFRSVEPVAAARAILFATSRFHHPAHAAEWTQPHIDKIFNDVWKMLMNGLCVEKPAGKR